MQNEQLINNVNESHSKSTNDNNKKSWWLIGGILAVIVGVIHSLITLITNLPKLTDFIGIVIEFVCGIVFLHRYGISKWMVISSGVIGISFVVFVFVFKGTLFLNTGMAYCRSQEFTSLRWDCVGRVAAEKSDLSLCMKAFGFNDIAIESCIESYVKGSGDEKACETFFKEKTDREDCLASSVGKNLDGSICEKILDEAKRLNCYYNLAEKTKNPEYCSKTGYMQQGCAYAATEGN